MKIGEKPLISFCLYTYNQAQYIKDAVEGALNQTYTPLEIILSDDCSTDNTFTQIQELVNEYKGPHKIVLNRNKKNLGLAEHINYIASIAKGEWLVFAAGDDISLPDRTSMLFELVKAEKETYYAGSGVILINERGKEISNGDLKFDRKIVLPGCMAAYHRNCFDLFDRLHPNVSAEDIVLPYRALLLGNITLINSPLVKYRVSTYDFLDSYKKYAQFMKGLAYVFHQRNTDLRKVSYKYPNNIVKTIIQQNDKYLQNAKEGYENKKSIIDIYDANLLSKIRLLTKNQSFSQPKKIKLFLLSFKYIRIMYGHFVRYFQKGPIGVFNNEKVIINLNQLLNKEVIIQGFNDIEL